VANQKSVVVRSVGRGRSWRVPSTNHDSKRLLKPDDFAALRHVDEPNFSPDGQTIAITDTVTNTLFLNWFQPNVFVIQVLIP
jgi:hypothetical protein